MKTARDHHHHHSFNLKMNQQTNGSTKKTEDEATKTVGSGCGSETSASVAGRPGRWFVQLAVDMKAMWLYFTTPAMLIILLTTPVIWFLHSFVYLGVIVNANNFTRWVD